MAGWLQGQLVVRPILRRFMREHTRKPKGTIEERAKKSRVYPCRDCELASLEELPSSALSGRRRE